MKYYVYIIECQNGHYYTGYTTDIQRRYQEHVAGLAKCKFTRSFPPKRLAACWLVREDRGVALSLERKIKGLSHHQKSCLAHDPNQLSNLLRIDYNCCVVSVR